EITTDAAMITQPAHALSHCRIGSGDASGIAHRTEILRRIKTERRRHSERACTLTSPGGTEGLSGVFDDRHIEFCCKLTEGIHVRALTVEMNRQQRAQVGKRSGAAAGLLRVEVESARINIGKHRPGLRAHDGAGRGEKTKRRSENRIARLNPGGYQRQPKRVGARSTAHDLTNAEKCCRLAFKSSYFVSQDELLRITEAGNSGQNLLTQGRVLPLQVEQWNTHVGLRRSHSSRFGRYRFAHGGDAKTTESKAKLDCSLGQKPGRNSR